MFWQYYMKMKLWEILYRVSLDRLSDMTGTGGVAR